MSVPTLQLFDEHIWIANGTEIEVVGFRYPTRMVIVRLSDGGLFLWSPIFYTEELGAEVATLGEVRYLVAPNSLHHLFLHAWRQAFPNARLYAAPGLRSRRMDLEFDADLGDEPPPEWAEDIDQVAVRGNRITTELVFFHRHSGRVIFTDLIQHFRPGWFTGWRALVARMDLMVADEPSVPRKFRAAFLNRPAARVAIRRILAWPFEKVLMAHGAPIEHGGRAFVARAFEWLRL